MKNIFKNISDKATGVNPEQKQKIGKTDKFTNITLQLILIEVCLVLAVALMSASIMTEDTNSTLIVVFNVITMILLFGLPVIIAYFGYDFFFTIKGKKFKNYSKGEHNKISSFLFIMTIDIAIGFIGIISALNFKHRFEEFGSLEIAISVFLSITIFVHALITYFVVWFSKNSKQLNKAIYAGSFDPMHDGHISVIKKALNIFDSVTVVVADNDLKQSSPIKTRHELAKEKLADLKGVKVSILKKGLLADYAKTKEVSFLIRSARDNFDYDYELKMAENNKIRNEELETVLIMPDAQFKDVSSTTIRESENPFAKPSDLNLSHEAERKSLSETENNWFNTEEAK